MKVKDLIEALSKLDPDAEVWKANWYHENSKVAKIEAKTFTVEDEDGEDKEVTTYVIE